MNELELAYNLKELRESYIDREVMKILVSTNKMPESSEQEIYIKELNSRYMIKPIKSTIPSYYNNVPLRLESDLSNEVDEENDTIVYQHPTSKRKFLNVQQPPTFDNKA